MAARPGSALEGVARLVVDGTNLLHRLGRGTGSAAPPAAIVGRLRAAVPAEVSIELVFDGSGHGVTGRVAQGMRVRYSGRRPADDTILELVAGDDALGTLLVVTDDRDLRRRLMTRNARSVPLAWLVARLDRPRLASPAPGNPRPAGAIDGRGSPTGAGAGPAGSASAGDEDERPRWSPGRGATRKRGPARRQPRHRRHPTHGAG